ncbi:uncharacterized protein LOC135222865 [Macrobrachium nipponense]|uniref:uncharacterized protein LOC135222865 n=1 Tax=Macrobrachium nipponense TaxID=159736 RepID=UPI0030C869A3
MMKRSLKLCLGFLLLCACTHVKGLNNTVLTGLHALKMLQLQKNIEPLCNCSAKLIPKVKEVHDVLWVLSGLAERAQTKAAVNVEMHHKNSSKVEDIKHTGRSSDAFGEVNFLDRMHRMIPSIEQIHVNISRLGIQGHNATEGPESGRSSESVMSEILVEDCPYHSTNELHKNLTNEVTEAAHFMANVENDESLAEATLLGIRKMVVEMNNRTDKFENLLERLKSLPCPKPVLGSKTTVRSFGEEQLDCSCVEQLLPLAQNLKDLLSWVIQVLKETQAHALLTIFQSPSGRTASENDESERLEKFNRTFLGVDFYASFRVEPETPTALLSRSALQVSEGYCPLLELLEYKEKLEGKMTDALHHREDVKGDSIIAKHILNMVNDSVDELSYKQREYEDFTEALENRNCLPSR